MIDATGVAQIAWFWQPPIDGQPGLLMIVDLHPGPEYPGVPFVFDDLPAVMLHVEFQLPKDIGLQQLRIYVKDILGVWVEVAFTGLNRRFKNRRPKVGQPALEQLWWSRDTGAGAGGLH